MLAKVLRTTLLAAIPLAAGPAAMAANLVVDGGFEADAPGNYSAPNYFFHLGPSTFGPGGVWQVNNGFVGIDGFAVQAHSGTNSLLLAPGNPLFPSDLTQTLATTPGTQYRLSFFAAAGGVNTFSLSFGGVPVAGAPSSFPSTIPMFASDFTGYYMPYSFLVTANSNASVLELGGTSTDNPGMGPDTINIDDISVTPAAVPEPAAIALLAAGLLGLGVVRRRARN
ncbi:MAG: PEP-CTERM sorting domain-containing protein [Acetobacteraceae bacterium]